MARSKCKGKHLCLFMLPCIMMSHLFIYIMVSIFVAVNYSPPRRLPIHFTAPGASSNTGTLAPHPLAPFWNLRLVEGALWNRLQHVLDREHNPILRGNGTRSKEPGSASLHTEDYERKGDEGEKTSCGPDSTRGSLLPDFGVLPGQMQDFVLSMHCRRYKLLMDPRGVCAGPDSHTRPPLLLIAVKSQVGHFQNRQAIRETWGKNGWIGGVQGGLVQTVFLLGRQDMSTGPHPDLASLLELESRHHGDILQWDFRDTFFNLTLKDVLFWDWLSRGCPDAGYIFKGDDDVFVRTDALLEHLHRHHGAARWLQRNSTHREQQQQPEEEFFLIGDVISNAWPNRQPSAKYYIPESFYKSAYPSYAGGGGVLYSGAMATQLHQVSRWVTLFPIDDVYLGMCLQRLGVSPTHHPGFLTFDLPESERGKPCVYSSVLLVHKRSPQEMLTLFQELRTALPQC